MAWDFTGEMWHWRGPSPYHFVTVPDEACADLEVASRAVTYGYGMVPVIARVGGTWWRTALWPKDGGYVLPVKVLVRRQEGVDLGDLVDVHLEIDG